MLTRLISFMSFHSIRYINFIITYIFIITSHYYNIRLYPQLFYFTNYFDFFTITFLDFVKKSFCLTLSKIKDAVQRSFHWVLFKYEHFSIVVNGSGTIRFISAKKVISLRGSAKWLLDEIIGDVILMRKKISFILVKIWKIEVAL